jgi:hypothetical protein
MAYVYWAKWLYETNSKQWYSLALMRAPLHGVCIRKFAEANRPIRTRVIWTTRDGIPVHVIILRVQVHLAAKRTWPCSSARGISMSSTGALNCTSRRSIDRKRTKRSTLSVVKYRCTSLPKPARDRKRTKRSILSVVDSANYRSITLNMCPLSVLGRCPSIRGDL